MEKYGNHFDEMPAIDYTYAHDLLYVFQNFDETHFGVLERIDPAKKKAKADIVVEAFKNGPVQNIQDLSGRIVRLRNFQKLRSVYHSDARNNGTSTENGGLDTGSGEYSDGSGMLGTGSGDQIQYQQRTYALTDWEVLEHAYDALDKTAMEPGERTALDIFKGRLDTLRDLQSRWTKVGQNWYKNSGYFCPPLVSKKG